MWDIINRLLIDVKTDADLTILINRNNFDLFFRGY